MTLGQWIAVHGGKVRAAWLDQTVALYGDAFRDFVRKQHDPFANPGGAILKNGIDRLFAALAEGADAVAMSEILRPVIRLKAVQDVPPSEALAFVPLLKTIVRAQEGAAQTGGAPADNPAELELERRIDALLLVAFDVFVECRQAVYQLRVNEMKRNVARLLNRFGERDLPPAGPSGGED
ncbi:MAG: RsbRD N-terminal domain-containing protein [bacterium]|nr:RsbRD N-terminal domain-containing protein [bacterium]